MHQWMMEAESGRTRTLRMGDWRIGAILPEPGKAARVNEGKALFTNDDYILLSCWCIRGRHHRHRIRDRPADSGVRVNLVAVATMPEPGKADRVIESKTLFTNADYILLRCLSIRDRHHRARIRERSAGSGCRLNLIAVTARPEPGKAARGNQSEVPLADDDYILLSCLSFREQRRGRPRKRSAMRMHVVSKIVSHLCT